MTKHLFITALAGLALSACSTHEVKLESPSVNSVKNGQLFRIILPENHQTGYVWSLTNARDLEEVEYLNAVWHGNEKGVYYNFESRSVGTCSLNFSLIKYNDTSEVKTFIVKVE